MSDKRKIILDVDTGTDDAVENIRELKIIA